jgi:Delta7-sterol 5-desaturase
MVSLPQLIVLGTIAILGNFMALFWYVTDKCKAKYGWEICVKTIYALPIKDQQVWREVKNSLLTPVHALILGFFVYFGFFRNTTWLSFILSLGATFVWAEIWHYSAHRAYHTKALHWIHLEHHKSALNSPFTGLSFSFWEDVIFDLGLLLPLVAVDYAVSLNFYGIASWYLLYLYINSYTHANYELKPKNFNRTFGRVLTSATYHSLHHSRYTGNYGLATRFMDRMFGTEWKDYEQVYDRIAVERRPLTKFREMVDVDTPNAV